MTSLVDFRSYDLGRLLEHLREVLADHPEAPAAPVLRAGARRFLAWDQRYSDAWSDPSFPTRYSWLREQLLGTDPEAARVAIAQAASALASLLEQRVALDAEEPA